jgi:uncharacterized membrane protein
VATRDGRRSVGADRTFVTPQAGVVTPPAPQGFVTLKSRATLKATRAGRFSVQIGFASNAPAGFATVTVKRKGKTIARKSRIAVVAGQSRTVKLKLTTRGRKLIKPGSTKKVRVRITLPGSDPAARTLKLKRRR